MITRRQFAANVGLAAAALTLEAPAAEANRWQQGRSPWPLCLDTATIRPQSIEDKIRLAAKHGFDGLEPWEHELSDYEKQGGSLDDLGKRIRDAGLFVPSVIGLWKALPATDAEFEENLPACRERMRQARAIGARHVQVIPWFEWPKITPAGTLNRRTVAGYYRRILEIGLRDYDLQPAFVFLEFVHDLRTIDHAVEVLQATDHPRAQTIPDTFHMHVGGTPVSDLSKLAGSAIGIFQIADAPANVPRQQLKDSHRVLPGDGVLPLVEALRQLRANGYTDAISLELYNRSFHDRDPDEFLPEAHAKTLAVIERSAEPGRP
ncbi:MAG: sugar phosphate isomerase/epimerase [Planctomycetota bacterium]